METHRETVAASVQQSGMLNLIRNLVALFKLRVVLLLLVAAVGGAFLGAGGWPGLRVMLAITTAGGPF